MVLSSFSLHAQDSQSLSLGVSYLSNLQDPLMDFLYPTQYSDGFSDVYDPTDPTGTYAGEGYSSPVISAEWRTSLSGHLSFGISAYFCNLSQERLSNATKSGAGTFGCPVATVLPVLGYKYCDKDNLQVYSSLSLGIGVYFGQNRRHFVDRNVYIQAQAVPIGIRYGRRAFVFAEAGYGSVYAGGRVGAGVRF